MTKDLLQNKEVKERAIIRGREIAKLKILPKIKRKDFGIGSMLEVKNIIQFEYVR